MPQAAESLAIDPPGFLAEQASPPEGWEDVVDRYLSDLADAVVLDAGDDAVELAGRLADLGGAGILLRPLPGGSVKMPAVDDPSLIQPLAEALGLADDLARSLSPAYLVAAAASTGLG